MQSFACLVRSTMAASPFHLTLLVLVAMAFDCSIATTSKRKDIMNYSSNKKSLKGIVNKRNMQEVEINDGLEQLLMSVMIPLRAQLNCIALISDPLYDDVFTHKFFKKFGTIVYFKMLIPENEDLSDPNYDIFSVLWQIRKNGCRTYIAFLANGDQMSQLLRFGDNYRVLNSRANFIVLYDNRLFHPQLHYLWRKFVNVIFIRQFGGDWETAMKGVQVNVWYEISTVPFPSPIKEVLVTRRLDTWKQGKFQAGRNLFKEKTENLQKQLTRIVTFENIPSAIRMPAQDGMVEKGTLPFAFGGLEIEIMKTLSSAMNFIPLVYETSDSAVEQWGRILPNGTFSGLLGEMVDGRAAIALGNFYYTPYYLELMDLSVPYTSQCLTFLTPELLTDNSWKTLILPFKPYMWIAVIVTLFLGGFIFYALFQFHCWIQTPNIKEMSGKSNLLHNKWLIMLNDNTIEGRNVFQQLDNSILYTFGMLLLVSLPRLPSGWSLRMLTGWWWIYCLLVVVGYRASMTAILANPAPRVTIDTLEQLAHSSIACGGWGDQQREFFLTSLDSAGQKVGRKFEVVSDTDMAVDRVARGTFALYGNIYYLHHASVIRQLESLKKGTDESNSDRNLHIMKDCAINMPISLGLERNSPLKPRVDKYLRRIIEGGLVGKWLADAMLPTVAAEPLLSQADSGDSEKALMNLKKLYGGLVALGVGYFISISVLVAELVYWHHVFTKSPKYDQYALRTYYSYKMPR